MGANTDKNAREKDRDIYGGSQEVSIASKHINSIDSINFIKGEEMVQVVVFGKFTCNL